MLAKTMLSKTVSKTMLSKPSKARGFFTIVNESQVAYRSFLGSGRVALYPGIHLKLPLIHQTVKIDLRERHSAISNMACYTKDNVPVVVHGLVFYVVLDSELACFSVENYEASLVSVASSAVRTIVGTLDYDDLIQSRNEINAALQRTVGDSIDKWGVRCTAFEMVEFGPGNDSVKRDLLRQMEAERARRQNELNNKANIDTARSEQTARMLTSDAALYEARQAAEGRRLDEEKVTLALEYRIAKIKEMLPGMDDAAVASFILEQDRLHHLSVLAGNSAKTTYFVDPASAFPSVKALFEKQ